MALSREMEYHADAIAAGVAGGNNLVTALARLDLAERCQQKVIQDANELVMEQKRVSNIFTSQSILLREAADQFKLPIKNGLPEINYEFSTSTEHSRINIKNQWASHPTLAERKQHLDVLETNVAPVILSPWHLFNQPDALQQEMTIGLYKNVVFEQGPEIVDSGAYEERINKQRLERRLPPEYNGFYDGRYPVLSEDNIREASASSTKKFGDIFNEENGQIQTQIDNNQRDLALAKAIYEKNIKIKSFDFDGRKFLPAESNVAIGQLEADIQNLQEKQARLDKEAFAYFYANVPDPVILQEKYLSFLKLLKNARDYSGTAEEIFAIHQRISETITLEQANAEAQRLREIDSTIMAPLLRKMLQQNILTKEEMGELYDKAVDFISKDYQYFADNAFFDNEVAELFELNIWMAQTFEKRSFEAYQSVLEFQLNAIGKDLSARI